MSDNFSNRRWHLILFVPLFLAVDYVINLTNNAKEIILASETTQLESVESNRISLPNKYKQARELTDRGKLEKAIAIYLEILKIDPKQNIARQELALVYAYNKNYPESIALYNDLITEQPNNLKLKLRRAEVKSWAGKYRESIADYQAIIQKKSNDLDALLGYAEVLSWAEKYESSLQQYEKILANYPDNYRAIKGKAEVTYWLGENRAAIALYQQALQQYPNDPELQIGLARVYYSEKYASKAIETLQPQLKAKNPKALKLLEEIRSWQSETEVRYEDSDSGEENSLLQETISFRVNEGDNLYQLKAGYGRFEQPKIESINNYSVEIGLERRFQPLLLTTSLGVDFFDRLDAVPKFNLGAAIPFSDRLNLDTNLKFSAFKDNAETLENEVNVWSLEPNLIWQIDRKSWLYLLYKLGLYNDGNLENQLGFGLGRNIGQFFIGANLFYWTYQDDLDNGYFDPADFFSYNGEVGWEGKVFDFSKCRLSASIGRQSFAGNAQNGNTYQAGCTISFTKNSELDLLYRYTNNARFQNSESGDSEQEVLSGILRFLF
jgi:tetratricopeptide (TPR) repeat protein